MTCSSALDARVVVLLGLAPPILGYILSIRPSACQKSVLRDIVGDLNFGQALTGLSLKVSMTLSPPSLEANTISTTMKGCVLMILHCSIGPPIGVMALSTSAAVVPGAKFWPMMVKGPASPRIDMPWGADRMLACD